MTTPWPELLSSALVGTDRRSPAASSGVTADPAESVLEDAAVHTVRRRAGVLPVGGLSAPAAAPADTAPLVGAGASNRLAALLGGSVGFPADTRHELVMEWLRSAAAGGLRIPPELLPDLLHAGRNKRDLRPLIVAAGGARVGWLATLRPEWTYLAGTVDGSVGVDIRSWHEGSPGQRRGYLTAARREDPGAARALLAADWPTLPPVERADLLADLAVGLGPADEAFLEQALDDRHRKVRLEAATLLQSLPGARYGERMAARARSCVFRDGAVLTVEPPSACDKEMRRDGVAAKPPAGTGERAWWLEEVLARTPLSAWTGPDGLASDPASFVALPVTGGWTTPVRRGLARAVAEQQDPAWAAALIEVLGPGPGRAAGGKASRIEDQILVQALYPALPPAEVVRLAISAFSAGPAGRDAPQNPTGLDRLLELCPVPWPPELSAAVLSALETYANGTAHRVPHELWQLAPVRLSPACSARITELAETLPAPPNPTASPPAGNPSRADDRIERLREHRRAELDRLAAVLRFRHDLIQELS